jgi:hypothetical protein
VFDRNGHADHKHEQERVHEQPVVKKKINHHS